MIAVSLNKDRFFYDVHSLVKAFYPAEDVSCFVRGEKQLSSSADAIALSIDLQEETGSIHAELSKPLRDGTRQTESSEIRCIPDAEAERSSIDLSPRRDAEGNRIYNPKNALKRLLYQMLSEVSGQHLPWGSLTGIRPTHIPKTLLSAGRTEEEILSEMKNTYFVSDAKAALALEIAKRERQVLAEADFVSGYSLYIGIPFCPTTCLYCSFPSWPLSSCEHLVEDYLTAIEKELDYTAARFEGIPLFTIYIGGGTPTTLSPAQLDRLIQAIERRLSLKHVREFTVESGRPDSITKEKLKVLSDHGVNRISINPQTMQQRTLDFIGRRHSVDDVRRAYAVARETGSFKINTDLILGLPGESAADVADTLDQIAAFHPDDLTIHALAVKRGSRMQALMETKGAVFPAFDDIARAAEIAEERARGMGLVPYYLYRQKNIAGNFENTGYAREDAVGLYNILINEDVHSIVALGAGAISKCVRGTTVNRAENVKELAQYLDRTDEMIRRKEALYG